MDWRPGDPVAAFAVQGPYPPEDAQRQVREAAAIWRLREQIGQTGEHPSTITGTRVDPATAPFLRDRFSLCRDMLLVRDGTKPAPVPHLMFIGVVCVLAIAYNAIRLANDVPPRPEEADET
jgi:hypothetical protein